VSAPRSHHERGQLFGTDGHSTWFEPELGTGEDAHLEAYYEERCEFPDDDFELDDYTYEEATGDFGQWD